MKWKKYFRIQTRDVRKKTIKIIYETQRLK